MDKIMLLLIIWAVFFGAFGIAGIVYLSVDGFYVKPIADNSANEYCKALGFDQYKTFSREGLWSEIPIGIKCEYAERYTDLGVRT